MTVYIRVVFLKLGEIDTLKENFAADAFIQARWREPALDGKTDLVSVMIASLLYFHCNILYALFLSPLFVELEK